MAGGDCQIVPARSYFAVGQRHACFTVMGQRFKVWLGDDISHDGNGYQPGPVFSAQDVENVKKCQRLMGDVPDGWFGPRQWAKLLAAPQRTAGAEIPVDGLRITQQFGVLNARYAAGKHTGVDFGDSGDDAIRCVAAGTVVTTDFDRDGWGNRVIVKHANERYSWYCHLASRAVDIGDSVHRGDKLGMMGSTGNVTGKHLHYQESVGGKRYDQFKKPVLLAGLAGYQG